MIQPCNTENISHSAMNGLHQDLDGFTDMWRAVSTEWRFQKKRKNLCETSSVESISYFPFQIEPMFHLDLS